MEFDPGFLEAGGISTKDGMAYTGGKEKYIASLQRYLKSYEGNKKAVREFFDSRDIEGFMIKAHALKSNSRMIGAGDMAARFEALENAARNHDTAFITENTEETLEKYDELIGLLKPVGEMEEVHSPDEISSDEAKQTAESLLEALDEFDDELSSELVSKLMGYPFRITQRQKLEKARQKVADFLYDEAAELIREILPAID